LPVVSGEKAVRLLGFFACQAQTAAWEASRFAVFNPSIPGKIGMARACTGFGVRLLRSGADAERRTKDFERSASACSAFGKVVQPFGCNFPSENLRIEEVILMDEITPNATCKIPVAFMQKERTALLR
jgi:hypothetical protein